MKKLLIPILLLITFFATAQTYQRVAPGEYASYIIDSVGKPGKLYASGGNSSLWSSGNTGVQARANLCKDQGGAALPLFTKTYAGLDDAVAIDVNGYVWHLGAPAGCNMGNGELDPAWNAGGGHPNYYYATKILTDSSGAAFTGITQVAQYWLTYSARGWVAIKGTDSTVWIWGTNGGASDVPIGSGAGQAGFRGISGYTLDTMTRPVRVTIPGGRKAVEVVAGTVIIVRCSDGTVWSWGGGQCDNYGPLTGTGCNDLPNGSWKSPQQVKSASGFITGARAIAGGRGQSYILCGNDSLWGWGPRCRLGLGTTNCSPEVLPIYLTASIGLPHGVTRIVTNVNATHAILSDSTLYGWGSSPQGEVGNSIQINRDQEPYPTKYGWNYYSDSLVASPVQLVQGRHDFVNIHGATAYTYWFFDEAVNGQLYFNGRNKGAVAANGVINQDTISSSQAAYYDNGWNIPTSAPVDIFKLRSSIVVPAPPCVVSSGYTGCGDYVAQPYHASTLDAGTNQTGVGTTCTLTGTSTPYSGRKIASYVWSQVSGPSTAYFNTFNDSIASVSRLTAGGTYVFRLTATDNLNSVTTDDVTITTAGTGGGNVAPVANAGSNQTITLPANQVTLAGSGTDADGTVVSYSWAKISGSTTTISNSNTATTTVTFGGISGIRVFRLTVTDNQGATGTADVTITVNAAVGGSGNETNDFITEDGSVDFPGVGAWNYRISRPRNMFTANHPDTASRPAIIFMVGVGEACNCPSALGYNGPHAIYNPSGGGWNGGLQLGNGTHYPIYISVQPWAAWPSTKSSRMLIEYLLNTYHIKRSSVHLTGLSMGAMTWTRMINSGTTANRELSMSLVKSIAALQGQGNAYYAWRRDANNSAPLYQLGGDSVTTPETYADMYTEPLGSAPNTSSLAWKAYKIWAKKYGGRYFSLEGTADFAGVENWLISESMNDTLANTGYFAWENIGGGQHCCWNNMYDPSATNWTSVGTLGPGIVSSGWSGHPNTMGNYHAGDNIFTWMLKQGDTSLVGFGGTGHQSPTVFAGNNLTITLPTSTASLNTGSATANNGGSITTYAWTQTSGAAATILSPATLVTNITGLSTAGVRIFTLTVTDNEGSTASSDVSITVNAAPSGYPTITTSDASTTTSGVSLTSTITASAGIATTKWTKFLVPGQTKKKLTVVGSSTTVGNGTTVNDSSFVNRLKAYYKAQGIVDTIYNKGANGSAPWDHNITADLSDNPDVVLLNFPSNQYYGQTTAYIMGQFQKWADSVANRGAQFYVTGTQPRPSFSAPEKAQLIVINDSLRLRFGNRFIELLKPLSVQPANTETKAEFDALDGVHINDAGHREVYNLVRAANVFQNTYSSASLITLPGSANTSISGLVNGTHKFQVSVVDNNGFAASTVSTVTVNIATSNQSPSANAGANQTITLPTSQVTLTGSGSDPDGTIAAYAWTQTVGIPANIVSPATASTNITGMTSAGTRVFRLTVTDNSGATGFSDVTITVNAAVSNSTAFWSVNGKYTLHFIDANGKVTAQGNRGFTGVCTNCNGAEAGSIGVPEPVLFPTNMKFKPAGAGHFHGAALIDTTGHVWTMGATEGGESGMGNITYTSAPQKILTDTSGNAFDSVTAIVGLAVNDGEGTDQNGYMALKSTGTIWVWGTVGSMLATGTAGDTHSFYKPKRLTIPGNRSAMQIVGGYHCMILCTDSTVWTWGGINSFDEPNLGYDVTSDNQIASLHQVTIPGSSGVKFIAGGGDFNYALCSNNKLYGFGKKGVNMCNQATVIYTPTELTNVTNYLPAAISKLTVSNDVTAALCTDGTLWTWGDNTQAGIGNGQQYYGFGKDTLHGYAWTYNYNLLSVITPYHVAPTRTFNNMWSNNLLAFNTIAQGSDGQLYEWGTSKGCTIADQISGPLSGNLGYHDQSWNRRWPTPINPFSITTQYITGSPACKFGYSDSSWCDTYDWRALPGIKPIANAGGNLSTSGANVTLDGSNSSDDIFISYYEWSQVSGPNTSVIDLPAAKRPIVSNLVTGTYVFKLRVIDNEWLYDSSNVTVFVNVTNQLPTAYAGPDTSFVLPVSSVQLDGTGSIDADGTIASYQWGQKSGPSTLTFSSTSAARPTVSGFIAGTYVIQLFVTDNNGGQSVAAALKTITASGNQDPVANAGVDQGITLPVSTVSLVGTGTDPDGTVASYLWTQVSGTAATIASPSSASTTITGLTTAGVRIFRLRVTDNGGAINTDDVQITVNPVATPPPTANAGADQTITLPTSQITLTGTSTNAISYRWNYVSGPFTGTISAQTTLTPTIIFMYMPGQPTSPETFVFSLTATNSQGVTATDNVTITVNPAAAIKNIPGRIEAENFDAKSGPFYAVTTTDVSGVQDLVGIMLDSYMDYNVTVATTGTYTVTFRVATLQDAAQFKIYKGASLLKTVNITNSSGWNVWEDITVTGVSLTAGAQTLRIISTSSDACNFNYTVWTLTTSGNQPPSANAGSNQAVLLPTTTATLTGSGSDPESGVLTYAWSQISGTTATIAAPTSATTSITGLTTPGTRIFRLTVTDDGGLTATSDVAVIVGEVPNKTTVVKGLLIGH